MKKYSILLAFLFPSLADAGDKADDILKGLKAFTAKTALKDGSFRPGIDPDYKGMSDSAYSNFAPVAYAVVIHRTFGWTLPHEAETRTWVVNRQLKDGAFEHTAGTVDPKSAPGRVYNTTMALMALKGLDAKPAHDPLPVFAKVMEKGDYKNLPAYSSSFFPLAYRLVGAKLPEGADQAMRGTMIQAADGYLNDHVAATFHAVHYDKLLNVSTPKADLILKRCLSDQKPDGSWMLNPLARDRHACFDAVFMLKHLGREREDCKKAMQRAADWVMKCRNADGGFGHYPGSPSDWDAVYFHVGVLVMAGRLTPTEQLPKDAHLLGWGHLFADARKLRVDGRSVSWDGKSFRLPCHKDEVIKVFGKPDRIDAAAKNITAANDIMVWDQLGLFAYVRPRGGETTTLAIALGDLSKDYRFGPRTRFTGDLTVDGMSVTSDTSTAQLNQHRQKEPFQLSPSGTWCMYADDHNYFVRRGTAEMWTEGGPIREFHVHGIEEQKN